MRGQRLFSSRGDTVSCTATYMLLHPSLASVDRADSDDVAASCASLTDLILVSCHTSNTRNAIYRTCDA